MSSQPCTVPALSKMNKTELLAEAVRVGLVVHRTWSNEELKAILREYRENHKDEDGKIAMRGLAGLTLPELKAKADSMAIHYPSGITKGNLLRLIRDNVNTPGNELMTFGRYRGFEFQEVPTSYGEWAVMEANRSDNASPDLVRFAKWYHKERTMKKMQTYGVETADNPIPFPDDESSVKSGYPAPWTERSDTYISAVNRNYKGRPTSSSAASWEAVSTTPQKSGKGNQKTVTPKRNKPEDEPLEHKTMESEVDPAVLEEIRVLQTRLAVLKDKAKSSGQ